MGIYWSVFCFQVPIAPGMMHNHRIPFRGKADEVVSLYVSVFWCFGVSVFLAVSRQTGRYSPCLTSCSQAATVVM